MPSLDQSHRKEMEAYYTNISYDQSRPALFFKPDVSVPDKEIPQCWPSLAQERNSRTCKTPFLVHENFTTQPTLTIEGYMAGRRLNMIYLRGTRFIFAFKNGIVFVALNRAKHACDEAKPVTTTSRLFATSSVVGKV